MRLVSLHAENLLSFERFDLAFREGLNVIVGPNGAGKSNVIRLVGLVRTALHAAASNPTRIDVSRYLRLGGSAMTGAVSVGIELTEHSEKSLMVGLVRAVTVSGVARTAQQSPSLDSAFEQALDARVRASVTEAQVDSLFRGRLVLQLDAGPPPSWSLAYEFDHAEKTYHYGIAGAGIAAGWVAPGPTAVTKRTSWGSRPLDLPPALTSSDETTFSLDLLLPTAEEMTSWEIKDHPTGQRLALVEELARALEVGPRPQSILPFHVFRRVVTDGLVLTADLRRPPRGVYDCAEVGSPVGWEDAGDLPLELYRRMVGERTDRAAYHEVQTLFTQLTGYDVEIRADLVPAAAEHPVGFAPHVVGDPPRLQFGAVNSGPEYHMRIRPVVTSDAGDIPVEFAGAGLWEALVGCAAAIRVPGRVVLLDEPAANLHPPWQRQFLSYLASLDQVVLITHSPYLVPAGRPQDLARITRLYRPGGETAVSRLADVDVPEAWRVRWRQILHRLGRRPRRPVRPGRGPAGRRHRTRRIRGVVLRPSRHWRPVADG